MTKPLFRKQAFVLVVLLLVAGVGLAGLMVWRDRMEKKSQEEEFAKQEEVETLVDMPEDVVKPPSETTVPEPTSEEDDNVIEIRRGVITVYADEKAITAELPSGTHKILALERVNDWLNEDTFIEQTFDYFCGAEFSPNGQDILLGIRRPPTGLATSLMVIWNISEDTLLLLSTDGCTGVWSPNSRYIAYDGGAGAGVPILKVIDAETGKRLFTGLEHAFFNTYFSHWSSDSTQIYFRKPVELETLRSDDDPLWVISVDGTGLKQVE